MSAALCAQQNPTNFSNNTMTSTTLENISPDGTRVLVSQGGFYGTLNWGQTTSAFASLGLSTLNTRRVIWSPNSLGVYVAQSATIGTTTVTNLSYQGLPANRSILQNINPPFRLFCVDRQNQFLYGTQTSGAGSSTTTTISRVPLTGPANLQILRTLNGGSISEMEIDPSGTRLAMLFVTGPFSARQVLSMPASGVTAPVTLTSGTNHENIAWINGQSSVVFLFRDPSVVGNGNNNSQVGRVDVSAPGVIVPLTGGRRDHLRLDVSEDQQWISYHVRDPNTGTMPSFEEVPAVMPAPGGGEILLTALARFDITTGRVRVNTSSNGTRIAYSARQIPRDTFFQIYGQSLSNEIIVTPSARVGVTQSVSFANPGSPNNFVGVILNLFRAPGGTTPPVVGPILVNPVNALAVIGISNAPNPTGSFTVPNNTAFLDVNLFLQAFTGLPSGAILASRMVETGITL